jgi:transposase
MEIITGAERRRRVNVRSVLPVPDPETMTLRSELRTVAVGMIEIITGRERRRRWSVVEKPRIVAESQESGTRVCDVATRHDVSPSLLHGWRHLARQGLLRSGDAIAFVPVRLAPSMSDDPAPRSAPPASVDRGVAAIEVVLPLGGKILIRRETPVAMLRAVIAGLRG